MAGEGHMPADDDDEDKNNRIYIVPHGRNFRGSGGSSDQCSTWGNK